MIYPDGYRFTSRKELSDALLYFHTQHPNLSIDRISKAFVNKYKPIFNMKTKRPGYNFIRDAIQR
jgi:hypothetical protein